MGPVCANWKGLELLYCPSLHADLCPPPKTMRPHQPQKKTPYFGEIGRFFPVAPRSNPRCSKAQIASYLAQIRRFLAPTAWASSTSTTEKISPQATQAWFRKGSCRFWACFFWAMVGKGPWLSLTCLRHHRLKQYNWHIQPMGGIEPLHIPPIHSLDLKDSPNPSWMGRNRGGPLASKDARKAVSPPTDSFVSESGPPKNNLFWRNRAFFPWPLREAIHAAAKLKLRAIWPK